MRFGNIQRIGTLLVAVGVVAIAGCGSSVDRTVDVSQGDYYTDEEFKKLSKDQRNEYCAALDQELASLEKAEADAERQASAVRGDLQKVQNDVKGLQGRYDGRKAEVDRIQEQIDYYEGLPKIHVVEKGEFLYKISGYEAIYADPTKWPRIYRANKDKISDPNLIYPGWELVIPRDWPMSWRVKQDEYLSRIASYWEVYGNGLEWPKIFEANRDKVKDADLIWPDWELTIPRN